MDASEAISSIADEGFCVVPDLLDPLEVKGLDAPARPLMDPQPATTNWKGRSMRFPTWRRSA
jgi:hypothetical protein